MALVSPSFSISGTTTSSLRLLHLQHQHSTLSLNFHTITLELPKLKAPITYHSLSHHLLQLRASTDTTYTFNDSQSEEESEEEEEEEEAPVPSEGTRLYVGNLPYTMTSKELTDIFSEVGKVASVEIVYDRVTDRSRGFAFVTMQTVDEAKQAIMTLNGAQVGGRSVRVNFPEVPRGGEREVMGPKIRSSYRGFIESPYKIYAGNLSWKLTSQGLKDAFDNQPGILSAKVIYERDSGRSRGFGFITFASMSEAQNALDAMNEVELEGRPLRLNLAAAIASTSDPQPQETMLGTEIRDSGNTMQPTIASYE